MSFYSSARLRANLEAIIPGGDPSRVAQCSYELSLGREAYLSGSKTKSKLSPGEILSIDPGRTALLLTEESVSIPPNALGFISLKSRAKLPGLINVSGFHVDPGFTGRLVFTVYNAGTDNQTFTCGEPLFLLWIADLDDSQPPDPYHGVRQHQSQLPTDFIARLTGQGSSPAALEERLAKLEDQRAHWLAIWVAIAVSFVLLVAEGFPWSRLGQRFGEWMFPSAVTRTTPDEPSALPAPTSPALPRPAGD